MINYNDDKRIDPKFYGNDGSEKKNVIKILIIVLLVGAVVYGYGLWKENQRGPALPGEVILKGDMDIATADALLQEAGYVPVGEVNSDDQHDIRFYESSEAFGYTTMFSQVSVAKSGSKGISFIHYFKETSEGNTVDKQGEVFKAIYVMLIKQIDEYPTKFSTPVEAWTWKVNKKTRIHMAYISDDEIVVEYQYIK